jgi:hypothetical protein
MMSPPPPKKILVLSDDNRLARAIELILDSDEWIIEKLALSSTEQSQPQGATDGVALIVVALSSPLNEPVTALNCVFLANQIAQIPLLIISEKRMHAHQSNLLVQMDFPFDVDEFRENVLKILSPVAASSLKPSSDQSETVTTGV